MEIIVTDRETIESGLIVRSAYVVVSIHDPDRQRPRVRRQAGLRGVLHVPFHDAEPVESMPLPAEVRLMTAEDAAAVWAFLNRHRPDVGAVVAHCEQGMSRSPAVAAAVARAWGEDERRFWRHYQPNRHVYALMAAACH